MYAQNMSTIGAWRAGTRGIGSNRERGNLYCGNLLKEWNFLIFGSNINSYGCARSLIRAAVPRKSPRGIEPKPAANAHNFSV